jgi:hypothetical protein
MIDRRLPQHRALTEDELRGYRYACDTFALWGRQIAEGAEISLAMPPGTAQGSRVMAQGGRLMVASAEAMRRTIGRNLRITVDHAALPDAT